MENLLAQLISKNVVLVKAAQMRKETITKKPSDAFAIILIEVALSQQPENVIGRGVRLSRARTDRDFTRSVGLGLEDQDLTSVPGQARSRAFKMSVEPV